MCTSKRNSACIHCMKVAEDKTHWWACEHGEERKGIFLSSEYLSSARGKPYADDACLLGYCGVI